MLKDIISRIVRNGAAVGSALTAALLFIIVGSGWFQTAVYARGGYLVPLEALGLPNDLPALRILPLGYTPPFVMLMNTVLALGVVVFLAVWTHLYTRRHREASGIQLGFAVFRGTVVALIIVNTVRVTAHSFLGAGTLEHYLYQVVGSWILACVFGFLAAVPIAGGAVFGRELSRPSRTFDEN